MIEKTGSYPLKKGARDKNLRPCLPLKPQEKIVQYFK